MTSATPKAYAAERRRLLRRRTVVGCKLAMVLVPLFGMADYFAYRPHFEVLMGARLASFVASGVILFLLRRPVGRRHPSWFAIAVGLEVGLAIAGVPVYVTGSVRTPHYVSTALLMLSLAAMLPWATSEVALLCASLTTMFIAGAALHGVLAPLTDFGTQVSALIVTGVIAIVITSLSEKVRAQEFAARRALGLASKEKTRLICDLEQKTGELQVLNQEMEDLLYVASHDLRAPLINVQGFANEVCVGLSDLRPYSRDVPEAKAIYTDIEESLQFIQSAVRRMDGLIGGLLGISRIATRTNPTEEVDLPSVVEKILESFRYQLNERQIGVTVGPLPTVRGDALRLNQVFSNLIDNAIKYMADSPRRAIEIGMRNGHGEPTLFVKDTGPGIPPESQETVFRLFRRLGNSVPGEGLGLTMVRKIIEKHGGRVWVESAAGQGSTFCFTLPRNRPPLPDPATLLPHVST